MPVSLPSPPWPEENIQKTIGSHLPVISAAGHPVLPLSPDRPMGLEIGQSTRQRQVDAQGHVLCSIYH